MTPNLTSSTLISASRTLTGDNPFGLPPEVDLLQPARYDIPKYSETYWFTVWDPTNSVGLFIHAGRVTEDVDLWFGRAIAYLPGGRLVVDRSFGRATDGRGPCTGNLRIRCDEPMKRWTLSFDGAGESTTSEQVSSGYSGSGPYLPMRFTVECNAVSPVWDLGAAVGGGEPIDVGSDAVWMGRHQEQGFVTSGELTVDGQTWGIDGIAYRDHSWGARDMSDFSGDAFMCLVFPQSGRVVQGLQTWNAAGELSLRTFYISEGGEMELIGEGYTPRADDLLGNPRELTMKLSRASGEEIVMHGRALHNAVITMSDPNIQCNGVPSDTARSLILNESPITFTWPDGEVGYGHTERGLRIVRGRPSLPLPSAGT